MMRNVLRMLGLLLFVFLDAAEADTIRLKRNVDINGTVIYVNGNITISSRFSGRDERMTIGREHVTEVRFNTVVDNPGTPEGWMRQLEHRPGRSEAGDDIMNMADNREVRERIWEITPAEVVTNKGRHGRSTVRRCLLAQN